MKYVSALLLFVCVLPDIAAAQEPTRFEATFEPAEWIYYGPNKLDNEGAGHCVSYSIFTQDVVYVTGEKCVDDPLRTTINFDLILPPSDFAYTIQADVMGVSARGEQYNTARVNFDVLTFNVAAVVEIKSPTPLKLSIPDCGDPCIITINVGQ